MTYPRRSTHTAWRLMAWLMASLVVAQTLGLMHGVVHARHGAFASGSAPVALQAEAIEARQDAGGGWVAALFPHHDKFASCELFDQASQGNALPSVVALVLPLQLLAFFLDVHAAPVPWFAAAFHQARAPPLFR